MNNRCPPGVICIENFTVLFILCTVILVGVYFFLNKQNNIQQRAVQNPVVIEKEIVDLLEAYSFIKKSGAWISATEDFKELLAETSIKSIYCSVKEQWLFSNYRRSEGSTY